MEPIYALGVTCIEQIQYWLSDYEGFFEVVNDFSNPHNIFETLFPVVSAMDSVFGSQLLLCMAFGSWLNSVMKWWLFEDRPYWWVRETTYYTNRRPQLRQFRQSCETGPGCPSGHSATSAMILILFVMWISHVMNDRKFYIWWWKYVVYPLFAFALASVMFARMFVATHFPHQVFAGALVGLFLAPALCIYVSDPFVWQYGFHANYRVSSAVAWHVVCAATALATAAVTYVSMTVCGFDPQSTVKLAFRWCENPNEIHVSTTPIFALVQSTASLFGWALAVTPAVAKYRHYSKDRSLILSIFTTAVLVYSVRQLQENVDKANAYRYYATQFAITLVKPLLMLRVTPMVATWPYSRKQKAE